MKKMLLVDPALFERMKRGQNRVVADVEKQMDKVMEADIPLRDKVREYNNALTQLNIIEDKIAPPPPPPPPPQQPPALEYDILESVPLTMRKRAKILIDRIKHKVGWDERGQLIVQGRVVPGSHILDLVNDALRPRKRTSAPHGRSEFARELQHMGVPHEIVQNPAYHPPPPPESDPESEGEDLFQDSYFEPYKP
jgi:hypothetical protein